MTLIEKINQDLIDALKSKDELKTSVLRMLKSAIKNKEIAIIKDLSDEEVIEVLAKEIKQRKDSAEEYKKGNRPELAKKEEKEVEIISKYMPEQISKEEITKIVEDAIAKTGAASIKDMGKVMGAIMPQVKGKADGTLVSQIVKEKLG